VIRLTAINYPAGLTWRGTSSNSIHHTANSFLDQPPIRNCDPGCDLAKYALQAPEVDGLRDPG